MNDQSLPPAWADALQAIERRRTSPILMPAAIVAVAELAGSGKLTDGGFGPSDFDAAFAAAVSSVDGGKKNEGWRPLFHLSKGVGLWSLHKGGEKADFTDLKKGKPGGRAALLSRVDRVQLQPQLAEGLAQESARRAIQAAAQRMLAPA